MTISPTQSQALTVLRSFLLAILPSGVEVIQAQGNRVPEPKSEDFVTMTPLMKPRLATNLEATQDCSFIGSISEEVLTVTELLINTITPGNELFGFGVAPDTIIGTQITGERGGTGTYNVSPSQTVPSEKMACGTQSYTESAEFIIQLDVHGPNSGDNAVTISTMLRSGFAVDFMNDLNPNVTPLHADDPKQSPFTNDQNQVEQRWMIEAHLEVDTTVMQPQQFFDGATVVPVNVDTLTNP